MENITDIAKSLGAYLIGVRREMHKHPETRFETEWTRKFILEKINGFCRNEREQNFTLRVEEREGGIIADLFFDRELETVLFRADFDALNVAEETGLSFSSLNQGKSHACGHDVNTAMLLAAMKAIVEGEVQCSKNIRFVFQDAEENPGTAPQEESGGSMLVNQGITNGISQAYALHVWTDPDFPCGKFGSKPGPFLGNSGRIYFKIKSSGGHVAKPHRGTNALRVVNEIMNHLNTFIARRFNPTEPATLEPVIINSGTGTNIMPAEAEMWYGFRSLLKRDEHIGMTKEILREVRNVAECFGAEVVAEKEVYGHPSLINDESAHQQTVLKLHAVGQSTQLMAPLLGGEDFAHFLYQVPGTMFVLGASQKGAGDLHSPTFNPDESVFWKGVLFWLLLATGK